MARTNKEEIDGLMDDLFNAVYRKYKIMDIEWTPDYQLRYDEIMEKLTDLINDTMEE